MFVEESNQARLFEAAFSKLWLIYLCVTKGTKITRYMIQKWTLLSHCKQAFVEEALTPALQRPNNTVAGAA